MATIFPSNPTVGDTYNGYRWTGTVWEITGVDLTASYQPLVASVSDTELGYLDGVTSSIQTQLDAKSTASKTETLTNKTINLSNNTVSMTKAQLNSAVSDADVATLAGSETLTNKTVNLTSNTLSGTVSQFNAALSDDDFVTINGSEYPKYKTFDKTNRLMGAYFPTNSFNTANGDFGLSDATGPIVYITGSTAGANFSLPPASGVTAGQFVSVSNISTVSVNVKTDPGTAVNVIEPGQTWRYIYVNTTGTGIVDGWICMQDGFSRGALNLNVSASSDPDPLIIKSQNGHGGTGFAGIQTWTNSTSGATNINKYWRIGSTGQLELINSAYTANLLNIADNGIVTIGTTTASVTSNLPTTNALSINGRGYLFDDGNFHIHSSSGNLWINSEGSRVSINSQSGAGDGVELGGDLYTNAGYGSLAKTYGVRAWISCGYVGGNMVTNGSGNLSVSRSAQGKYVFTFGTAMPDGNYSVVATAKTPVDNSDVAANIGYNTTTSTTGFTIHTARYGSGFIDVPQLTIQVVR